MAITSDLKGLDPNDGSFGSRKFLLTLLGLSIVTIVTVLAVKSPAVAAVLPTFVGGILGVLSLYFTGNIMTKHVIGRHQVNVMGFNTEEEEEEPVEVDQPTCEVCPLKVKDDGTVVPKKQAGFQKSEEEGEA